MTTAPTPGRGPTAVTSDTVLGTHDRRLLLLVVVADVVATVWYFGWLLQPGRVGNPVLFGLLLLAEVFNLLQAAGFWWTITRDARPVRSGRSAEPWLPASAFADVTVDVLVPRYDEVVEIVEPVLRAAAALRGAVVRVHLLDDGDSPEMAALAARLGVGYITREEHRGAKAGNINHALGLLDGEFVAVFDCDHVPHPEFLERTLGAFADPRLALVQTPQYYANADRNATAATAWSQQALFFGAIGRGKDGVGAMFCCGTNMVFRRAALDDVEGFPEDSVTEDFVLSIRLQERRWRTRYVPEVLVQGLGPEDMAGYVGQQMRWASGCLDGLGRALRSRMGVVLKAQYALSAMYFLTGWSVLIYLSLPVVRILTGAQPIASSTAAAFLVHFAPYFLLSLLTVAVASGSTFTYRALALTCASYWVHIAATVSALSGRRRRFVVTPKSGRGSWQPAAVVPGLATCAVLLGVSVWGLLRTQDASMLNNVAFALLHVVVIGTGVATALRPAALARRAERGLPTGESRWQDPAAVPGRAAQLDELVPAA